MRPIFTGELRDIVPRYRSNRIIDISDSPLVPAGELRWKLELLHRAGELDGGLPILRHQVLVGLIPAPELEFALDKLVSETSSLCLMASDLGWSDSEDEDGQEPEPTDFTPYIDKVSYLASHLPRCSCFSSMGYLFRRSCVIVSL